MYFKRIELQGFKSFAEPVVIDFRDGITCIVGPNGSGKSNISDAIRWVLGEQSPRMLRGGKMEEVIFAGTVNRKSRGMAEVTLVIDNTTHFLPIDYAEVAITRRMYRSGDSEYLINRHPCRLKDIRELIMDTGIGVEGYSIIGQGKIADIVSNKTESRREIFEEAAGIVKYRAKKAESERKLESSRANLDRVDDIVAELEGRIGGLEEDSCKAREYLSLRERYKDVEINITLKNIETIELKNEYIKDDITELDQQMSGMADEKAKLDQETADRRRRSLELEQLCEENRDKLMRCGDQLNQLNMSESLGKEKLQAILRDKERLDRDLLSLGEKIESEVQNGRQMQETRLEMDQTLEELKQKAEDKARALDALNRQAVEAQTAIEQSRDRLYEGSRVLADKNSEISSLQAMKEALDRRKAQLEEERSSRQESEDGAEKLYETAKSNKEKAEQEQAEAKKDMAAGQAALSEQEKRRKQLEFEGEQARMARSKAEARKHVIEEMEQGYEGYHQGVSFIMQRGLKGLYGTVADLIRVPAGFETAIETALGAGLQNIVCQSEEDARDAIAELKRNRAGRLTFLPLTGIRAGRSGDAGALVSQAGVRGIARDCIQFDTKYEKVFDYLLGRVIIVDNLDSAIRLSRRNSGGFRFVTMDGEVINAGGAVTGGASKYKTAGLLERKAEATRLEQQIGELGAKSRKLASELGQALEAADGAQKGIRNAENRYREAELARMQAENEIRVLESRRTESEEIKARWDRELVGIAREDQSAGGMISALQEEAARAREQIAAAQTETEEGATAYDQLKAALETASAETTEARLELAKAENRRAGADDLLARVLNHAREMEVEKGAKEQELARLAAEQEGIVSDREQLEQQIADKDLEKRMAEENLKLAQEEKAQAARTLVEIQEKKEQMDGVLLGLQENKHELELKLTRQETQVETYKEKLWEEFEVSYIQAMEFGKTEFSLSAAVRESRELKNRIKELGEVNVGAIKEYESVKERYDFLTEQRQDLLTAMEGLIAIIEDMDKNIRRSFKESFERVQDNFQTTFQALFGGGMAELRLENENDPLNCGIDIIAQPPGKKLQNINLLSGGEKTMTAIALMFAVLKAKPTPFCILDEVEAALDDINIDRFGKYLKDFKEVQFALITHQKATMEHANVLYGVTMPEQGISKVISLKLGDDFKM